MMNTRKTRGKDLPLRLMEQTLEETRRAVTDQEAEVRRAKWALEQAQDELALRKREVVDIERAIEAVRALPTLPLVGFQKAARS